MFSDLLSAAFRDTKSHRGGPDDVGSPREGNISPFRRPDEMASSKPYTIADRQGDLEQYASQLDSTDPISTPISVEVSAESAAENEIQVAIDLRAKGEAKKALNSLLSLSKGPIFLHLSAMVIEIMFSFMASAVVANSDILHVVETS